MGILFIRQNEVPKFGDLSGGSGPVVGATPEEGVHCNPIHSQVGIGWDPVHKVVVSDDLRPIHHNGADPIPQSNGVHGHTHFHVTPFSPTETEGSRRQRPAKIRVTIITRHIANYGVLSLPVGVEIQLTIPVVSPHHPDRPTVDCGIPSSAGLLPTIKTWKFASMNKVEVCGEEDAKFQDGRVLDSVISPDSKSSGDWSLRGVASSWIDDVNPTTRCPEDGVLDAVFYIGSSKSGGEGGTGEVGSKYFSGREVVSRVAQTISVASNGQGNEKEE